MIAPVIFEVELTEGALSARGQANLLIEDNISLPANS